jgi:hypothetical protein
MNQTVIYLPFENIRNLEVRSEPVMEISNYEILHDPFSFNNQRDYINISYRTINTNNNVLAAIGSRIPNTTTNYKYKHYKYTINILPVLPKFKEIRYNTIFKENEFKKNSITKIYNLIQKQEFLEAYNSVYELFRWLRYACSKKEDYKFLKKIFNSMLIIKNTGNFWYLAYEMLNSIYYDPSLDVEFYIVPNGPNMWN